MRPSDAEDRLRAALARPMGPTSDHDLNLGTFPARTLRPAAVLVAVDLAGPEARVILTKRSAHLRHHPGQIAFPGGKLDEGDRDATEAALREAGEEVGLPREAAEVIGTFGPHETVTGFQVTAVVALIRSRVIWAPGDGEVDEVFAVPLAAVTDPTRFRVEGRLWQGRMRHYYVVPHGPHYIWGASARILRALADRMVP